MAKPRNAISPTREDDYPEWYQQVVKAADLAENTPVRGCMVIKPWGYAIGKTSKKNSIDASKQPAIRMLISLYSFLCATFKRKPIMWMASQKNVPLSPIHDSRQTKMDSFSLPALSMSL